MTHTKLSLVKTEAQVGVEGAECKEGRHAYGDEHSYFRTLEWKLCTLST